MKWLKIDVELKRSVMLAVPVPNAIGENDTAFLNALAARVVRQTDDGTDWNHLLPYSQTAAVDTVALLSVDEGPAQTCSSSLYYDCYYLRKLGDDAVRTLLADEACPNFVRDHARGELIRRKLTVPPMLSRTLEVTVLYKNGTWERRYEQVDELDDARARTTVHDRLSKCPSVDGVQVGAFVPGPPPS